MYKNGLCSLHNHTMQLQSQVYSSLVCVHNYPKLDETLITCHKLSEVLSGLACSSSGKVSYECVQQCHTPTYTMTTNS